MDIDELKETRDTFAVWGYETLLSDELIEKIISILDAEITRQSVTDEDVQKHIETLKDIYPSKKEIVSGEYPDVADALDVAILALEAYQPWVTDKDVRKAIHSIKEHIQLHRLRNYPQLNIGHSLDLAIQALQQMRTEGCHSCKGIESHGIKSVKTVTDKQRRDLDAYNTPYNYCPNCGRELR